MKAAQDQLEAGKEYTDSITVKTADGTSQRVTVTINGTNDAAEITGTKVVNLSESDVSLIGSGSLVSIDVDQTGSPFKAVALEGMYGKLVMGDDGVWRYEAYNAQDQLAAGEKVKDTFTVQAADGTASDITVNITGTNDAAVISGNQMFELTETDAVLTANGVLTSTDIDGVSNAFTSETVVGKYGQLVMGADGQWNYEANTAHNNFMGGQDYIDKFEIHAADGTASIITVNIKGSDDASAIFGTNQALLSETNEPQFASAQLTTTDIDSPLSAGFVAQENVKNESGYGVFNIDANGLWTYATKDGLESLKEGEEVTDTFKVMTTDGSSKDVVVNIKGTNDAAVILGDSSFSLTETDSVLTTSGTLSSTDVDGENNAFRAETIMGTYGSLSMGTDGNWNYTANSAHDAFAIDKTYTDKFVVHSEDGTAAELTVQIVGTNDAPVFVDKQKALSLLEDTITTGNMMDVIQVTDADVGDTLRFALVGEPVAGFTLNADGTWAFDTNGYDHLLAGTTLEVPMMVRVEDVNGGFDIKNINVTITGTKEPAIISGDTRLNLTESDSILSATGTLTSVDVEGGVNNSFLADTLIGNYGTLSIDENGALDYVSNAYHQFATGVDYADNFTVKASDGTEQVVTVNITGTNDAPVIQVDASRVFYWREDTVESGHLQNVRGVTVTDPDSGDTLTYSLLGDPVVGITLNADGSGSIDTNDYDYLAEGEKLELPITVSVSDGHGGVATQLFDVAIIGTNDAAVISGDQMVELTETDAVLTASGKLTSTDVDGVDNAFMAKTVAGAYGSLAIDADGDWNYTSASAQDQLAAGVKATDTFTVHAADGTASTIEVNITGTNDAAVISGTDTAIFVEPGNIQPTATGQYGGHTYEVYSDRMTWTEAQAFAHDRGGYLVSVTSDAENNYVANLRPDHIEAWIGLHQLDNAAEPGGGWVWDSGEEFIYNAWDPAEPNDVGNENSAHYLGVPPRSYFEWNDLPENDRLGFIIEYSNGLENGLKVELTETNAVLTATGTLTSTDVDGTANAFITETVQGTYGSLVMAANGVWNYTASNAQNQLAVGITATDMFTVHAADGTASSITVNITGTNDAPVAVQGNLTAEVGGVVALVHGQLSATDADANATLIYTLDKPVAGLTLNPDGSYTFDTSNDAYRNIAKGTQQEVLGQFTVTDEHGASSSAQIALSINGDGNFTLTAEPLGLSPLNIPTYHVADASSDALVYLNATGMESVVGLDDSSEQAVNFREDKVSLDSTLSSAHFGTDGNMDNLLLSVGGDPSALKVLQDVEVVQFTDAVVRIIGAGGYESVEEATNTDNVSHANIGDYIYMINTNDLYQYHG